MRVGGWLSTAGAIAVLLAGNSPATASDGVIEINQAKALAGGLNGDLDADPAGFPVRITQPGSYRLTGNLVVGLSTDAIEVAADHVTLDLGGFSIRGPNDCVIGSWSASCQGAGTGRGIFNTAFFTYGTRVRNGSVRGMGAEGIRFDFGTNFELSDLVVMDNGATGIQMETSGTVSRVIADQNAGPGMDVGGRSVVSDCIATDNGSSGFRLSEGVVSRSTASGNFNGIETIGGVVRDSTASRNRNHGISGSGSSGSSVSIQGNVVSDNPGYGINATSGSVIAGNTVTGSGGHGISADARASLTENLIRGNAGCGVNFVSGAAGRAGALGSNTIVENNTAGTCTGVGNQRQFQGFSMATTCNVITCTTGGLLLGTFCPPNAVSCL